MVKKVPAAAFDAAAVGYKEKGMRKGSITVFLSLMLSVMLTVVFMSVSVVKVSAGRMQLANAADQSLWSLFARYDRDLLEDYDLFFIDGGFGSSELRLGEALNRLEEAADYIIDPEKELLTGGKDLLSLTDLKASLTGYRLASDSSYGVYVSQVLTYMKETEAAQGIQLIKEHYAGLNASETETESSRAEEAEGSLPSGGYQELQDMASAAKDGQESQSEESKEEASLLDPQTYADASEGAAAIGHIESLRKTSILNFVLQEPTKVSGNTLDTTSLPSARTSQTGMGLISLSETLGSTENDLLFNEYIVTHFGSALDPETGSGLHYPLEEIIAWKNSDIENLEAIAKRLLLIREGINLVHLYSNGELRAQASACAAALSCLVLMPELEEPLELLILVGWAYCESLLDVRNLFAGDYVPLVKGADSWQLSSLTDIGKLLTDKDSVRKGASTGLDYADYMRIFLMLMSNDDKVSRSADMIEHEVRSSGRDNFRFDNCLDSLTAKLSLKSEGLVALTTEKTFSYDTEEE